MNRSVIGGLPMLAFALLLIGAPAQALDPIGLDDNSLPWGGNPPESVILAQAVQIPAVTQAMAVCEARGYVRQAAYDTAGCVQDTSWALLMYSKPNVAFADTSIYLGIITRPIQGLPHTAVVTQVVNMHDGALELSSNPLDAPFRVHIEDMTSVEPENYITIGDDPGEADSVRTWLLLSYGTCLQCFDHFSGWWQWGIAIICCLIGVLLNLVNLF